MTKIDYNNIGNAFICNGIAFNDTDDIKEVEIIKYGKTLGRKGGQDFYFDFNESDADKVIKDHKIRGNDPVFDYEHQSLTGGEAPASGWVKAYKKTKTGLSAIVDWTAKASNYFKNREYRYFSPVLFFDDNNHPKSIHSIALTNHPAFNNMSALVADDLPQKTEEKNMDNLEKFAKKYGITIEKDKDGKIDELKAFSDIGEKLDGLNKTLKETKAIEAQFLGVHECKTFDDLTGKVKAMCPIADKQQLEARINEIEAEKAVAQAFTDCKLAETQREWANDYAKRDLKAFNDFCASAPKQVPGPAKDLDGVTANGSKVDTPKAFTDTQKDIMEKFGITKDEIPEFLKSFKEDK